MDIVRKILEYSDPYVALQNKVELTKNSILLKQYNFKYNFSKPLLIAVGKASYKMAKFFLERTNPVNYLIVTPHGSNLNLDNVIEAGHPQIDENSIKAGKTVKELLLREDYDVLFFLLSGGASALLEDPVVTLDEYKKINKALVESGLDIKEINIVRKHLSNLKGGRLAKLSKSPVISLIVSDVPGDDLGSIGSGPTAPDNSTVDDAKRILDYIGFSSYSQYLVETPKQVNSKNFIILNNMDVLQQIYKDLPNPIILTSEVIGDARQLGIFIASIYNSIKNYSVPFSKGTIIIGGEPDVKIEGKSGKGGRNGEVALSLLQYAQGNYDFYAIATDGIDGNSEYAGCIINGDMHIPKKEIENALQNHSSYELLEKYSAVVKTGLTYTNVNNVYILIVS
ncbi:glycerate 2-kinase [Acidianus manzaensis]|uniref:Glycerate kinase n=1 Tax=Acidianus manzaensis TaxID=282676 RepID=A0A1W6JZK5_9CREN|nr:glycerate 2-kinase [Acidianus manzaensis]ARM75706.1 glycerate kinase [Acidianus manzaensis]